MTDFCHIHIRSGARIEERWWRVWIEEGMLRHDCQHFWRR